MTFDVDDTGTAVLVAVTGIFWFTLAGTDPELFETVFVVGFTALTLSETNTISLRRRTSKEQQPEQIAATDGGDGRAGE